MSREVSGPVGDWCDFTSITGMQIVMTHRPVSMRLYQATLLRLQEPEEDW